MTSSTAAGLRIGIFTDDFFPESGGIGRSIELQVRHLAALGHEVVLYAPRIHLTPPAGATCVPLPVWHLPGTPSFLCSLRTGRRLARRLAREHQLDVVHSQNERGSIFLAAQVAEELGVPHVHTFHSNYVGTHRTTPLVSGLNSLTYLAWSGHLLGLVSRPPGDAAVRRPTGLDATADSIFASRDWQSLARLARCVDAFTSPARFMVDAIVEASDGRLAERAAVVETGVAEAFGQASRRRPRGAGVRFISCGRLGVEKRVDAVIDAFSQLGRTDAELVIIGSGPAERSLRLAASQVATGEVRFLGHIDDVARIAQEIADADAFVLASYRFDTQGMVLGEAAAAGTPVIYCDDRLHVGIGPENAVLTDPSPAGLAAAMRSLTDHPERLPHMSAAAKSLGRSLTPAAMAAHYVEVYRAALERRQAHHRPVSEGAGAQPDTPLDLTAPEDAPGRIARQP